MVTSSRAFNAGSLGALYYQRLWERPVPPLDRSPNLPENWSRAILRCLDADPTARFGSGQDLVRQLDGEVIVPARRKFTAMTFAAAVFLLIALLASSLFAIRPPRLDTSLVVFPIDDLANDPAYAHFSVGMTAELVSKLTKVEGLSVRRFY